MHAVEPESCAKAHVAMPQSYAAPEAPPHKRQALPALPGPPHLSQRGCQVLQQADRLLPRLPSKLVVLKGGSQLRGAAGALQAHAVAPAVCDRRRGAGSKERSAGALKPRSSATAACHSVRAGHAKRVRGVAPAATNATCEQDQQGVQRNLSCLCRLLIPGQLPAGRLLLARGAQQAQQCLHPARRAAKWSGDGQGRGFCARSLQCLHSCC